MKRPETVMYRKRIRLWSREIALAMVLTFAAVAFVGAAWLEERIVSKAGNPRLASGETKGLQNKP